MYYQSTQIAIDRTNLDTFYFDTQIYDVKCIPLDFDDEPEDKKLIWRGLYMAVDKKAVK